MNILYPENCKTFSSGSTSYWGSLFGSSEALALIATALSPFYFYLITGDLKSTAIIGLISLLIFYTHRGNIKRLINKEEDVIQS